MKSVFVSQMHSALSVQGERTPANCEKRLRFIQRRLVELIGKLFRKCLDICASCKAHGLWTCNSYLKGICGVSHLISGIVFRLDIEAYRAVKVEFYSTRRQCYVITLVCLVRLFLSPLNEFVLVCNYYKRQHFLTLMHACCHCLSFSLFEWKRAEQCRARTRGGSSPWSWYMP